MTKVRLTKDQADSLECAHTDQAKEVSFTQLECPQCVATGDSWVHLRICMICGQVGCCDDSKNKHATAHFKKTGHPLIKSIQPGEDWAWCYVDECFME